MPEAFVSTPMDEVSHRKLVQHTVMYASFRILSCHDTTGARARCSMRETNEPQLAQSFENFLEHTDLHLIGGSLHADAQRTPAADSYAADMLSLLEARFVRTSSLHL